MRLLPSALLAATAAFLWLTPAQAGIITFDYVGAGCDTLCANVGAPVGTPLDLKLHFDSASIAPNAVVNQSDLLGYEITIGTFSFSLSDAAQTAFGGVLDSTGNTIINWFFLAGDSIDPDHGVMVFARTFDWYVLSGGCVDGCSSYSQDTTVTASGTGNALPTRVVASPEPLTLSLFAAGLLGLSFPRRRSFQSMQGMVGPKLE